MIFDSNLLKIAGALIAGVAGLIGILGQTRTGDKRLTRSGKLLFAMAVVGVLLAVSTQIWEWRKSIESDRVARRKNQELLLKLDNQATLAANSLHEIKRALTRFETISFDWSFRFDITDKVFGPYIRDLAKLVEDATGKPPFREGDQGLHLRRWNPKSGEISAFSFDADSPAMPNEGKYALARHYILEAVPEIRVFKTPIEPAKFFTTWPNVVKILGAPWNPRDEAPRPDLILKLSSGKVHIWFPVQKTEPKVSSIIVEYTNMDASVSMSWGDIVSLEDLKGCQGIIHLSNQTKGFTEPWNTTSKAGLTCRINNQPITVSNLVPTQAQDGLKHSHLIYSFTFSTSTPGKVNLP